MKTGKTVVATFNEPEKAVIVKNKLEQAGIAAVVADERRLQRYYFLSRPLASQKVYVDDADLEKARRFLEQARGTSHLLDGEVRCLQCGSSRIEYPQFTRKSITTTVMELGCLLGITDREFYCLDCHFTWPATVPLRREADVLNWPLHDGKRVRKETG